MFKFPIGVMVESFRKDFRQAAEYARELGQRDCRCIAPTANMRPKT